MLGIRVIEFWVSADSESQTDTCIFLVFDAQIKYNRVIKIRVCVTYIKYTLSLYIYLHMMYWCKLNKQNNCNIKVKKEETRLESMKVTVSEHLSVSQFWSKMQTIAMSYDNDI